MDVPSDMLLLPYYVNKIDPQRRGGALGAGDQSKVGLLSDCVRHDIYATVFHDGLGGDFVARNSSEYVDFKVVNTDDEKYRDFSCNDSRFFEYKTFLDDERWDGVLDTVWCVDLFDVRMNRHPGHFAREHAEFGLFAGVHRDWKIGSTFHKDERWMLSHVRRVYGEVPEWMNGKPILMAGTFGGRLQSVRSLLDLLCTEICNQTTICDQLLKNRDEIYNCNMPVFNAVMHGPGMPPIWMNGAPLNSVFRAYEMDAPVCFVHK